MKNMLNKIRMPGDNYSFKRKVINSLLIFLFGIILGILSKWADNLIIDDSVTWQHIIGMIDLRNILSEMTIWIFIAINLSIFSKTPLRASLNVFLFFLGMTISYHLYTILFSGFNPNNYMKLWYLITLISPLLAYICWYAKSKHFVSIIISSLIIAVLIPICFNVGYWYFELNRIIYMVMFISIVITLHVNFKNTLLSLVFGIILSFIIPNINTIVYSLI